MHKIDRLFAATKAFIVYQGRILVLRESDQYEDGSNPAKFDVVGGRVQPGQRFDQSLLREIREETGLEVEIGRPFHTDEWRPNVRGEQWQVIGTYFICYAATDEVTLSKDHSEYAWIDPRDYKVYPLINGLNQVFAAYNQMVSLGALPRITR